MKITNYKLSLYDNSIDLEADDTTMGPPLLETDPRHSKIAELLQQFEANTGKGIFQVCPLEMFARDLCGDLIPWEKSDRERLFLDVSKLVKGVLIRVTCVDEEANRWDEWFLDGMCYTSTPILPPFDPRKLI